MRYTVTPAGRADPDAEPPDDDQIDAMLDAAVAPPYPATGLEDWREPWTNPARSEWSR